MLDKIAIASTFVLLALSTPSLAADSSDEPPSCKAGTTYSEKYEMCIPICKKSEVYSGKSKQCEAKSASLLNDAERLDQAKRFAYANEFGAALDLLWRIKEESNPAVWNLRGYATRKSGDTGAAIGYYHKALELDPDYVLAREYLGEGYLQIGDVKAAKFQLAEIAKRCGVTCKTYAKLDTLITEHVLQN